MINKIIKLIVLLGFVSFPVILFYSTEQPVYRLMVLGFVVLIYAPIFLFWFKTWLLHTVRKAGKPKKKTKAVKENFDFSKYLAKEVTTDKARNEIYQDTRDMFRDMMKNGQLSQDRMFELIDLIEKDCLGDYIKHYKGFKFQNEAHKIYTYLKNSHLNSLDLFQIENFLRECSSDERNKNTKRRESISVNDGKTQNTEVVHQQQ